MTEPEGPGPPRRAASPPGGGTVTEATASPTGIHPAPGSTPGVHSTVSSEAPRAELTGLELIDESTRQMPSNSISTNIETSTEVKRDHPAFPALQAQGGIVHVSTELVNPPATSAILGEQTAGISSGESSGQRAVERRSSPQIDRSTPASALSNVQGETGLLSAVAGPSSGSRVRIASPADERPNLEKGGQDLEEISPKTHPRYRESPASSSQARGETGLLSAGSSPPSGSSMRIAAAAGGKSSFESRRQDGEAYAPMPRRWADRVDSPPTSPARGETEPESPGSSSPSVHLEYFELQAGQISNLEVRGQSGVEFSPSQGRPPMPPSDPSLRSDEASRAGRAEEPHFGEDFELEFEETSEIQIFGESAAPPSANDPYILQRTPTSTVPPGGDYDGDERNFAASGSQSGIPQPGQRTSTPSALLETARGASTGSGVNLRGPGADIRAARHADTAADVPRFDTALAQTGTPSGREGAETQSSIGGHGGSNAPMEISGPAAESTTAGDLFDDSSHRGAGSSTHSVDIQQGNLLGTSAGAGSSSAEIQAQVGQESAASESNNRGGKQRAGNVAAPPVPATAAGTSDFPSRVDTDRFRSLTQQGVLGVVEEHMQILGPMIMSLDSKENYPDGRRVAQLTSDAIMSVTSWGTKTREENKEEIMRLDFRLGEVIDSVHIGPLSSDEAAGETLKDMRASYLHEVEQREKVESQWDEQVNHLENVHADRENQLRGELDRAYNQERLQGRQQLSELRHQLSEALGRLPSEQEKTLQAETETAKARSKLDEAKQEKQRLRERLREMEQEVADFREAAQSGGSPMSHQGRGITKEESLQAELDEQVQRAEQQFHQLSDLRAQLDRANQQSMGLGQKLEDTKAMAKRQLDQIKQRFGSELKRQREHTDRALSTLARTEIVQAGSAFGSHEEMLATLTTRLDQDQVVAQLGDQLREAQDAARQTKAENDKLTQQLNSLSGRYAKEDSVKKQKMADQAADLRATKQQLEYALAEGERLRDGNQQLANHRRPRGDDLCNDPSHQNLVSQIQIGKTQMREVQAEIDHGRLREAKLSQSHAKETEIHREARETWHSERQRQADAIDRLNRSLTAQRESSASREQDLRSQMEGLVDPTVSLASSDQALELSSIQSAYQEAEARNERLQEQLATLQVELTQVAGRRDELQAQLSSQSQPFDRSTTRGEPSPSYGVQLLMAPTSSSTSYGMPTSSHGVQLELDDCEQTPTRNAAGQFYALNLHEPTLSLVTRNIVRFKELVRENPFCFVMIFAYEWSRTNQSSQDNALQSAIQFCLQPGLDPASGLRQCSEPSKGYVVRHGFITGITFSEPVASASLRGAQNVRDYLFKPDSPFTFVPEAVEGNLAECCTRSFHPDWYGHHCRQADYSYPLYNYWHPLMPEWVQLLHGVPGQYLHAVTAHLFKHGQPEPDFQWIRGYQTGPDEEKDDDSFESMFEGLVPTVTPAAPGRGGENVARRSLA